MGPGNRSDHTINHNYLPQLGSQIPRSGSSTGGSTSPVDATLGSSSRFSINMNNSQGGLGGMASGMRLGAGSPSHEYSGSRLLSKRAREIQAHEGLSPQIWGPPTSGHSTPLRETIPESPNADSFPDFNPPAPAETQSSQTTPRRTRAGTLPSRFSPSSILSSGGASQSTVGAKSSRPTPSTSPFRPGSSTHTDVPTFPARNSQQGLTALARLRAGSMPQRPMLFSHNSSPFGSALGIGMNYGSVRDRSSTLHSIQSSNGPTSPAQSSFSQSSMLDGDVKTLDYLGLADTPQQLRPQLQPSDIEMLLEQQRLANPQLINLANANRLRSLSVNAKEKYAEEDELAEQMGYAGNYSGTLTPTEQSAAAQLAIQEAIRQHNADVQAFEAFQKSRPRSKTAGVVESPSTRLMRNYFPQSRLDNSMSAADFHEDAEYSGLTEAVHGMQLNAKPMGDAGGDETGLEGPTRALWLGNIPSSTTVSSLNVIFHNFGTIESTRVLTHKNCGFVNFVDLDSAVRAKSQLNGREIFPGAGPVRIGYAKVPSASATPGNNGIIPSPSPDPNGRGQNEASGNGGRSASQARSGARNDVLEAPPTPPKLADVRDQIIEIVKELGATDDEAEKILAHVDQSIEVADYETEIPGVPEPSHTRIHDAPRLREIRKRIDNHSCTPPELEEIALNMLPEVAELSSDYLGNTVVQKLFEHCSDPTKEAMLQQISPHLAEIGVHKNGTWAAQKIIDVSRTPAQKKLVVDSLRKYADALFLDQFGNYVMQGCLKYGYPLNDFIFDVMLNRLWDLAQGRFGARAMRACLESHHATKEQLRTIAAIVTLHSVQLATNANGALLLTWFLDTCTFPRRRTVLAPRLVPYLVHLCTHKLAYLTVLKIINQRNELEARDMILQALFFNDRVLEDILSDQSCGATLIFKVLTTPFFDEKIRKDVVENVRNVLIRIKATPAQGYKRLMDEVNLPTRGGRDHSAARDGSRPPSKRANSDHDQSTAGANTFYAGVPTGPFDPTAGMQRTASMDSNNFDGFQMNGGAVFPPGMALNPQALQYQQMMAGAGRGNFYPQMPPFGSAAPGMDNFRAGAAPFVPQGLNQQGYNPMMNAQMYGYPMAYGQQSQQPVANGRRGRR